MKRVFRRALRAGAIAGGAAVLLALAAALLVVFDKPLVRNILRSQLAKRAGMAVRIGRLDYSLFPFRIHVEALVLGQETGLQKLDVAAARVEARGSFWKLVRGRKSALESVSADGLEVLFTQKAVGPEPVDYGALVLQLGEILAVAEKISVRDSRLAVKLASQTVDLGGFVLDLARTGREGGYALNLNATSFRSSGTGGFSLEGGLRVGGELTLGRTTAVDLKMALLSPRFAAAGLHPSFDSVLLEAAGTWNTAEDRVAASKLSAGVPGIVDVTGALTAGFGKSTGTGIEVKGRVRVENIERVIGLVRDRLPADYRDARIRGRATLEGAYSSVPESGGARKTFKASVRLEGWSLEHQLSKIPVRAGLDGDLELDGLPPGLRISADLRPTLGGFATAAVKVGPSKLRLRGEGTLDSQEIAGLEVVLDGLSFPLQEGKSIAFDRVTISGGGFLDLKRRTLEIRSLRAGALPLPPVDLTGRLDLGNRGRSFVRAESRGFKIPVLREFLSAFVPAALAGWDADGSFDLAAEARSSSPSPGAWLVSGGLAFSGTRFNDPTFTIAGENLNPRLRFEGEYAPSGHGMPFSVSLSLDRGESLFKSFYVSWEKHPVQVDLGGRLDVASPGVDGLTGQVRLPTIGEVTVSGAARFGSVPALDLRTEARLSLGPLHSLYTQAGVAQENRMGLEGNLAANLAIRKEGDALAVEGRATLAGASIELPGSKTLLLDVAAELPVRLETAVPTGGQAEGPLPDRGFLRIGEFQSPFLTVKPVEIPLGAGVNALSVEPFALDVFGGRLELGRTVFRLGPADGSLRGQGSLVLREIDISRFPIQSPQFKLTGRIRADFPTLDISSSAIAVSGRGEADVFGGKVVLRDLAVERPFAGNRKIALNIDLLDLDLKKLTDEVPFGEVTGIVRGEVRGLVISYGQPERFDFRIESVRRRGVPQTFSLKAVDNLTVLSSGERASGGTNQFWMRFIRGFRYEKLGIISTLRNDTFTLNGTIREGGVEYLVKKPPLFGISVVNRMPEKVISFKEMTGRLKRVGQSEK